MSVAKLLERFEFKLFLKLNFILCQLDKSFF
jgi:hypothetical protein